MKRNCSTKRDHSPADELPDKPEDLPEHQRDSGSTHRLSGGNEQTDGEVCTER